MRYQRTTHRGSRPVDNITGEVLAHPRPTRHTAESYRETCKSARLTYLVRLRRMERREARVAS